jgi:hypothetical protein
MKELSKLIEDLDKVGREKAVVRLTEVREELKDNLPESIEAELRRLAIEGSFDYRFKDYAEYYTHYAGLPIAEREQYNTRFAEVISVNLTPQLALDLRQAGALLPDDAQAYWLQPSNRYKQDSLKYRDWQQVLNQNSLLSV